MPAAKEPAEPTKAKTFHDNLDTLVAESGISQPELAAKLDVPKTKLANWRVRERDGKPKDVNLETVLEVSRVFGCRPAWLAFNDGPRQREASTDVTDERLGEILREHIIRRLASSPFLFDGDWLSNRALGLRQLCDAEPLDDRRPDERGTNDVPRAWLEAPNVVPSANELLCAIVAEFRLKADLARKEDEDRAKRFREEREHFRRLRALAAAPREVYKAVDLRTGAMRDVEDHRPRIAQLERERDEYKHRAEELEAQLAAAAAQ